MATAKKTADMTPEERLKALYQLQLIDSEKNEIAILKGELPVEVSDLEDEIAGLEKRRENHEKTVDELNGIVSGYEAKIKESQTLIERYNTQLDEVKNNREYEALTKEVEIQNLDIELAQKRINETQEKITAKQETVAGTVERIASKKEDLEVKQKELKDIIAKTEKQEKALDKQATAQRKRIPDTLLKNYDRIRHAYRNGIAVAVIERDACGGCFYRIPSQKQIDIAMRKRIIACENCGRVLVDEQILEE